MNRQPDRTEDAYRAALGVMVEDTPPAPEWEDLLLPTEPIRSRLATTPRRGWAVALVAAGVVLALVGGIAISVIAFGSNEEVIEPPPTTMPTSIPEVFLDGRITAPAYADVPFFTGTVQYYEHDPVSGDTGWQATVLFTHAGPMQYEAEVLAEDGEVLALGGPGTFSFGDGTESWIGRINQGNLGPFSTSDFEPFRQLFFNGGRGLPTWAETCGSTPTELGLETVAGRTTTHVACSNDLEDYELWIDEQSGVVMKMTGPLPISDLSPDTVHDGLFEFTEIAFEYPPFHMVKASDYEWGSLTEEFWYLDDVTARKTIIAADDRSRIGSYNLIANDETANCMTNHNLCVRAPNPEVGALDVIAEVAQVGHVPLPLAAYNCTELGEETVNGRAARHFTCPGVWFFNSRTDVANGGAIGYWYALPGGEGTNEYWFDTATGLQVKTINSEGLWDSEVTLLEVNPTFPPGIFDFVDMYSGD